MSDTPDHKEQLHRAFDKVKAEILTAPSSGSVTISMKPVQDEIVRIVGERRGHSLSGAERDDLMKNILDNAIEAMKEEGIDFTVTYKKNDT